MEFLALESFCSAGVSVSLPHIDDRLLSTGRDFITQLKDDKLKIAENSPFKASLV